MNDFQDETAWEYLVRMASTSSDDAIDAFRVVGLIATMLLLVFVVSLTSTS